MSAVIVGYARSPFTPAGRGALSRVRPDDLLAQVIRALLQRTGAKPEDIEDVIVGCAFPEGEQGFNIGRVVGFLADLPIGVAGTQVNRWCGSSMTAVHIAAGAIAAGAGDLFVCAGVESMSRVPMLGFNPVLNPALQKAKPDSYIGMGMTAENLAQRYQIDRAAQQHFAVTSQQRARQPPPPEGRFADEIVPIQTKGGVVDQDGCIRADTTDEALSALKPAFLATGTVTAGTSSPLTDGASAVLVASAEYAAKHGLPVLARIVGMAVAGCAPDVMGIGPVPATRKALARAGIDMPKIDVAELNEAFAAQALAVERDLMLDHDRVNLGRRGDRARSPAGGERGAHHRQGRVATGAHRGPVRAGDDVRGRRPGRRHHPGARVMATPVAIQRCAVLGAGLMGSGIAAHLANAGLPVLLLDMPAKEGPRNGVAMAAIERMKKTDPAPLMLPENARLITPGNFDDDLAQLSEVDWIIEVVIEDLAAKRALYDRIDAVRKPGSIVSSNTSTIPLRALVSKQSPAFKADFCVTHFFNPPRYMRLLELVSGPDTRPEVTEALAQLCDVRLGKGVVRCKDTPGFIANRIGTHWITTAVNEAIARGIPVEHADAAHRPHGHPEDRGVRPGGPGRARPHAAGVEVAADEPAARGRFSQRVPRPAVADAHDRRGQYRT